jgi:hypothetical protein
MFQEQSFSTELCVNDREHRLTERGHKEMERHQQHL